jgi:long-chain acyl-CoA synthetase
MGGETSKIFSYGEWTGEQKPGETRILRHPDYTNRELPFEPEEGVDTVWKAFKHSVNQYSDNRFLGKRIKISENKFGEYTWKTYKEINNHVHEFAAGLIYLNLIPSIESPHDGIFKFLGIYSKNREEWVVAYLACHMTSTTVITFYDTLGENVIEYLLDQTKLITLMVESKSLKKLIDLKCENRHGNLKNLIVLDLAEDDQNVKKAEECGLRIYTYTDILNEGNNFIKKEDNISFEFPYANSETIATISYTSGTTGLPKGVMITHKNILATILGCLKSDIILYPTDVYLSYLPLAHAFEMMGITYSMTRGVSIGFFQGNPAKLVEDAQTLKPTVFIGVPRVYKRIYDKIISNINNLGLVKRFITERAIKSKLDSYDKYGYYTHPIWDRLIFNNTKQALGGRVRIMITGAAPIDPNLLKFLKICFCCPIIEGYGQTESCAGVTVVKAEDFRSGHVGGLLVCSELKLRDCSGLNYKSTDVDEKGNPTPRGEILLRGNNIFKGYFNDIEKTKNTIDEDGWTLTGDIGMILSSMGNALKIIDRVKNIFKLSHGEYIAPEKVENVLSKSKYVSQIFVHGESVQNYLVAIIVPNDKACLEFLKNKGAECNLDNVKQYYLDDDLVSEILRDLEYVGRKNDLKGFEIVKKFYLSDQPFSIENDLLTPTLKIKRNDAKAKYSEQIKKMYSENNTTNNNS